MAIGVRNNVARGLWAAPLALCCLFTILFLIAATIVISLIPVYLATKGANTNSAAQTNRLGAGFSSNAAGAAGRTVSNPGAVSNQLLGGRASANMQTGTFEPVVPSNRKKKQATVSNVVCEQANTLTGNLFLGDFVLTYPADCTTPVCQSAYNTTVANGIRNGYQSTTVSMQFTDGGSLTVDLIFCGFFDPNAQFLTTTTTTTATATATATTTIVATTTTIISSAVTTASAVTTTTTATTTATTTVAGITTIGTVGTATASTVTPTTNPATTLTTTRTTTTTTIVPNCTTETTNNIYFTTTDGVLYQFTPATVNLTLIGPINCSSNSTTYLIALQRTGILWLLARDGSLFTYNIRTAQCTLTAFVRNQTDIFQFTMGFVKNDNGTGETLYISKQNGDGSVLGILDINSLNVSIVGNYSDSSFPDLGGTNDGKLFGFFVDSSYTVKQINKTNAQILLQYPIPEPLLSNSKYYGFAPYGQKFFYFLPDGNSTDIHYFDTTTNASHLIQTAPKLVYNVATSTCLDTSKPVPIPPTACIPPTEDYIYLVDDNGILYQFNPITIQVTEFATINCSEVANVSSIALQRNGLLWVLFDDGDLYTFNLTDQSCVASGLAQNQYGFLQFSMAFGQNAAGSGEILYQSKLNDGGGVLGAVDISSLTFGIIGNYTGNSFASLSVSNDGSLYGLFLDGSLVIRKIDDTDADFINQYSLEEVFDGNPNHYSFATYGNQFVYLRNSGPRTYIHLFDPTTNSTTLLNTVPYRIRGAAISTCLDTSVPIIPLPTNCTPTTANYIYLINANNVLYQFSPTTLQASVIATINCAEVANVFSIALQSNGLLWVLYDDGDLYTFNLTDQSCVHTGFAQNQTDIYQFTMAFVKNECEKGETLFISKWNDGGGVLGDIDLDTFNVTDIGNYSDGSAHADLTGSNDGKLFGFFLDGSLIIREIDNTDAQILSEYSVNKPRGKRTDDNELASYDTGFLYFHATESSTYIYYVDPTTNTTTALTTLPFGLSGAATSTCLDTSAPLPIPQTDCISATQNYIYLVDEDNVLYRFDPASLEVTEFATINCSECANVFSIALQSNGLLWVLYDDGDLYTFNFIDQSCVNTGSVQNQTDISEFSMAFVKTECETAETLFISKWNDGGGVLGDIDLDTFNVTDIGNYSDGSTFVVLTGSNNGSLFGLFLDGSLVIKEIDNGGADFINQYSLDEPFDGNPDHYSFASYGNQFVYLRNSGSRTYIHLFDPTTNTTTLLNTVPYRIRSAATSTCLDTSVPIIPLPTNCTPTTANYIYLVDPNNVLYQFSPTTLEASAITTLNCSGSTSIVSIALQSNGILWILSDDDSIYTFNLTDQSCNATGFVGNGTDICRFDMAFVKNECEKGETLFISKLNNGGGVLGDIDLDTLSIEETGNYSAGSIATLTGSNDGKLFGFFLDGSLIIKEIDNSNAQILSEYPLHEPSGQGTDDYEFASYDSAFLYFHTSGNSTYIHHFDTTTNLSTLLTTLPFELSGAATSTCLDTSAPLPIPQTDCTSATQNYIYLVDEANVLYQFDPATLEVTEFATINCSETANVFSIALQSNAIFWVLFDDGDLYTFDFTDQSCVHKGLVQNQTDISQFSMAFVKNCDGDNETLFISKLNNGGGVLGDIDLDTLDIEKIGNYSNGSIADLTGTIDGSLFGLFFDGSLIIKGIDDTSAQILNEYPINIPFDGKTDHYTLAPYGNKFFFFHTNGNATDIHLFDPSTTKPTLLKTIPYKILDGATSTCFNEIDNVPIPVTDCTPEANENIYTVDANNNLYTLDATTFALTNLTTINCSVSEVIISIALQRTGLLWLQLTDGKLYTYNITTEVCTDSGFILNQTDIGFFTMTFVKNNIYSDELLYISKINGDGGKLASIDLGTLTVSLVGNYSTGQYADIHETEMGRLFGLFLNISNGILLTLRAIDATNAQILYEYPTQTVPFNILSVSFVPYVSQFIFAVCSNNNTNITVFDTLKNTLTLRTTLSQVCLTSLAGSTCLGA